jgi:hypothetical protein
MNPLLKYVAPLAVVLPLGGFVAGSLVSAAQDDPDPRTPIVLREDSSRTPATDRPTADATHPVEPTEGDRTDRDDDAVDDEDDHVVTPTPVDDDDDSDDDTGEDDDDGQDDGDDD